MSSSVLVTGAGGWVGGALVRHLAQQGLRVAASSRSPLADLPDGVVQRGLGLQLGPDTDWRAALQGVDVVVHCAARVHIVNDSAADPLAEHRRVNTEGTLALARQAAAAGVRRFLFMSTAHVNGTASPAGRPFREDDLPQPDSAYGQSKLEAEQGLRDCARSAGMQFVIIRPPLVVGPGVGGNVLTLMKVLHRGWPLPLAAVRNLRSLVGLDNLVDLTRVCIDHPGAAQQVFLASDGQDISTPDLLRRLGQHLGRPARLFPVPVGWLALAGRALGRAQAVRSLCTHLQVDGHRATALLNWHPTNSLDTSLKQAATRFTDMAVRGSPRRPQESTTR